VIVPNRLMSVTALSCAVVASVSLFVAVQAAAWLPVETAISRVLQVTCAIGVLGALTLGGCALSEERRLLTVVAIGLALATGVGLSDFQATADAKPRSGCRNGSAGKERRISPAHPSPPAG
jgi:hypothetical protein